MNTSEKAVQLPDRLSDPTVYSIADSSDIIRVDALCRELLEYYRADLDRRATDSLADRADLYRGAAYFLRDFLIDALQTNIFQAESRHVKAFAGHWYIISNLEPNAAELARILPGVADFYRFAANRRLLGAPTADRIATACREDDYYRQRITAFHDLHGSDYTDWRRKCPIDQL